MDLLTDPYWIVETQVQLLRIAWDHTITRPPFNGEDYKETAQRCKENVESV